MEKGALTTIPLNVPIDILWGILLVALVLFSLFSWVLVHHWNYYGIKGNNRIFAKSLYFVGAITFIVIAILLIGSYDFL